MYVTVQRHMHSDFHMHGGVHRRSTCHETFHFTMNPWLGCKNLSLLFFLVLCSPSWWHQWPCSTCSIIIHLLSLASAETLGATHALFLTPFATSWWLLCHQHLMSCKATSQTHSPSQTFCKLQCTSRSFSFKTLCFPFQFFLFSCYWDYSRLFLLPLQVCLQPSLLHFFKQLLAESQASYSLFAIWLPLLAP